MTQKGDVMIEMDSIVLYVEDIAVSRKFYTELLERKAQELSPTFLSFELDSGLKLELKVRARSEPPATMTGGGTEICFKVPDEKALLGLFEQWKGKGARFAQSPTKLVFGMTFVAMDPDGHRLRVFVQG
jgi:catechol 2,3-dioxygenase-like lactoylglutathione lyase family enzyme